MKKKVKFMGVGGIVLGERCKGTKGGLTIPEKR